MPATAAKATVAATVGILLSLATIAARMQGPQGVLVGRVVDAMSGEAIPGATVTAVPAPMSAPGPAAAAPPARAAIAPTLADDDGRFVIAGLPAGRITLAGSARGYLSQSYGALRPGGAAQAIDLGPDQRLGGVVLRLWKPAVVSGLVIDEHGEPITGMSLGLLRKEMASGRVKYSNVGGSITDDRGSYRVSGLIPGHYVLVAIAPRTTIAASTMDFLADARSASRDEAMALDRSLRASNPPPLMGSGYRIGGLFLIPDGGPATTPPPGADGRLSVARTTFYPTANVPADATVLSLGPGDVRTNIDIRMTLAPTVSISGTVTRSDGGPTTNLGVRLALEGMGHLGTFMGFEAGSTMTTANGRFTILGVPAGQYLIRARIVPSPAAPGSEPDPVLSAVVPVSVGDAEVRGLVVTLDAAPRVSGRVEFDGASLPTPAQRARMAVEIQSLDFRYPTTPPAPRAVVGTAGEFVTTGVTPGTYLVRVTGLPGWNLVSAMSEGRDLSDEPFDAIKDIPGLVVTLSDRVSTVSGVVRRPDGAIDPDAAVIAFPADRRHPGVRRRQLVRADKDGRYSLAGLPAGDYFVVAIDERVSADWEEPAFLDTAARVGVRVTVMPAGQVSRDLQTAALRRGRPQ